MLALNYGDLVRHEKWTRPFYAKVFTIEGYARKNGATDIAAQVERAIRNGHDLAGSIFTGTCITTSKAFYAREDAEYATAQVLQEGQSVMLEGRFYTVRFNAGNTGTSPRNSDPIRFVPNA